MPIEAFKRMLISSFARLRNSFDQFCNILGSSSKNSQFLLECASQIRLSQSNLDLHVRLAYLSCEFYEELLTNITKLSNEFLNVSKCNIQSVFFLIFIRRTWNDYPMELELIPRVKKIISKCSAKSCGFLSGSSVSSKKEN